MPRRPPRPRPGNPAWVRGGPSPNPSGRPREASPDSVTLSRAVFRSVNKAKVARALARQAHQGDPRALALVTEMLTAEEARQQQPAAGKGSPYDLSRLAVTQLQVLRQLLTAASGDAVDAGEFTTAVLALAAELLGVTPFTARWQVARAVREALHPEPVVVSPPPPPPEPEPPPPLLPPQTPQTDSPPVVSIDSHVDLTSGLYVRRPRWSGDQID